LISGGASEEEEVDIAASLEDKFAFEDELRILEELEDEEISGLGSEISEDEETPGIGSEIFEDEYSLLADEFSLGNEDPFEDEEISELPLLLPPSLLLLLQAKTSTLAKNTHKHLYFINASYNINIVIYFHLYNPNDPSGTAAVKSGIWIISKRGKHHISLTERKRSAPVKIIKKSAANFMAKGIKK